MATIRPQLPDTAQEADDLAEVNKVNADLAAGWAQGKEIVKANADAVQLLVADNLRIRAELQRLLTLQGRT